MDFDDESQLLGLGIGMTDARRLIAVCATHPPKHEKTSRIPHTGGFLAQAYPTLHQHTPMVEALKRQDSAKVRRIEETNKNKKGEKPAYLAAALKLQAKKVWGDARI
eukprot:1362573-Amorphochlora_amoeboformis.AAC.1